MTNRHMDTQIHPQTHNTILYIAIARNHTFYAMYAILLNKGN